MSPDELYSVMVFSEKGKRRRLGKRLFRFVVELGARLSLGDPTSVDCGSLYFQIGDQRLDAVERLLVIDQCERI